MKVIVVYPGIKLIDILIKQVKNLFLYILSIYLFYYNKFMVANYI